MNTGTRACQLCSEINAAIDFQLKVADGAIS